jgi:hypothetical protein
MSTPIRRRGRGVLLGLTLALVALVTPACSVPSDSEARAIDPARLQAAASSKQNCTAAGVDSPGVKARVYLVRQQNEPPNVMPVDRVLTNTEVATPLAVVQALVNCRVTDEEKRSGLATSLPDDAQVLGVDPVPDNPGIYEVRFGPLRRLSGQNADDLDKLAVAQIFFTLTDPGVSEAVRGVRFTVAGRPIAVNTDKRTVKASATVDRTDFAGSSPPSSVVPTVPPTLAPATTLAPPTTIRAAGTGATGVSGATATSQVPSTTRS